MDLNALRVFDSLYKLKITEEEFAYIEEEQTHIERTGLSIMAVKRDYSICVSHDEKHQIIIKRIEFNQKLPQPKSRILFKTLISFQDLPEEVYTLHQIAQYRALDTEIKYQAKNLDQLKDRICDRFADDYPKELGEMYEEVYGDYNRREKNKERKPKLIARQLKALFWLFNEEFKEVEVKEARANIPRIIKVFQRKNRRVAIIQVNEDYDKQRTCGYGGSWSERIERTVLKLKTYTPRDSRYNYVCPNREIYLPNAWEDRGQVWLDDDLFERVTVDELRVLSRRFEDENRGWTLLNADEYNRKKSALRIELMSARRKEKEATAKKKLVKSIKTSFRNGKVVRQGIVFTKKSVSYEGVVFKGSKIGEYLEDQNVLLQEKPNFTDIFEGYVDYVLKPDVQHNPYSWEVTKIDSNFQGKDKIIADKITVEIEKTNNNIFINNRRICKEDLGKVVKSALRYQNQDEYDEWVKHTSQVNLRLQNALKEGGIKFELKVDNTKDNELNSRRDTTKMLLSIPLSRQKGRNYVLINKQEYKVKDTNALFDLGKEIDSCRIGQSGGGYLQRSIKLLYKAIADISPKEIGELIRNGKREYWKLMRKREKERQEKLARSKKFIEHAVKITGAERTNGGYLVEGLSKTIYFVSDDLQVYTTKNGKQDQYLCIIDIDTEDDDAGKNDAIAKRLLMLSKDKKVAHEIFSRGDHMDKHWLEIQDMNEEVIA